MAWIQVVSDPEATGVVRKIYDEIKGELGRISPMIQAISLRPEVMSQLHELSKSLHFGGTSLGRKHEQMLAVVISATNGCRY